MDNVLGCACVSNLYLLYFQCAGTYIIGYDDSMQSSFVFYINRDHKSKVQVQEPSLLHLSAI